MVVAFSKLLKSIPLFFHLFKCKLLFRYLLARRHLVTERNREEHDEVSNKRLTRMAADIATGLAFLHQQK